MQFTFEVTANVERTEGKFASRDEIREVIQEWLNGANEGSVDGVGATGESTYDVTDWVVDEVPQKPKVMKKA